MTSSGSNNQSNGSFLILSKVNSCLQDVWTMYGDMTSSTKSDCVQKTAANVRLKQLWKRLTIYWALPFLSGEKSPSSVKQSNLKYPPFHFFSAGQSNPCSKYLNLREGDMFIWQHAVLQRTWIASDGWMFATPAYWRYYRFGEGLPRNGGLCQVEVWKTVLERVLQENRCF